MRGPGEEEREEWMEILLRREGEKERRVGEKVKGKRKKGREKERKEKREYPFQIFHNRWWS